MADRDRSGVSSDRRRRLSRGAQLRAGAARVGEAGVALPDRGTLHGGCRVRPAFASGNDGADRCGRVVVYRRVAVRGGNARDRTNRKALGKARGNLGYAVDELALHDDHLLRRDAGKRGERERIDDVQTALPLAIGGYYTRAEAARGARIR